mmetsp:Transcript_14916/g.29935  ORF Transcript_14916/g.29935 Transcript_14916/m.29935 type:complete len:223 (-) Transcript_14916:217-885(-)
MRNNNRNVWVVRPWSERWVSLGSRERIRPVCLLAHVGHGLGLPQVLMPLVHVKLQDVSVQANLILVASPPSPSSKVRPRRYNLHLRVVDIVLAKPFVHLLLRVAPPHLPLHREALHAGPHHHVIRLVFKRLRPRLRRGLHPPCLFGHLDNPHNVLPSHTVSLRRVQHQSVALQHLLHLPIIDPGTRHESRWSPGMNQTVIHMVGSRAKLRVRILVSERILPS